MEYAWRGPVQQAVAMLPTLVLCVPLLAASGGKGRLGYGCRRS
jgi:hypothetical protein